MARYVSDAAKVAREIRKELKAIGVKARVKSETYSGGDSVDIYTTDLAPELELKVKEICKKYQYGHFDAMTDCYEASNVDRNLVAQVKYVFVENTPSEEMIEKVLNWIDTKDRAKQFDTDEKIKKLFNDFSMSRKALARRIFRGYDLFGGYWKAA